MRIILAILCASLMSASMAAANDTPTEFEIQVALQADVDNRLSVLDSIVAQCENIGDNPLAAIMCMGTGFGTLNSDTMKMTINSVNLDECVLAQDGKAFCRYAVNVDASQGAASSQLAPLIGLFRNSAVYGSFVQRGSAWVFYEAYSRCNWGNGSISCTPAQ